MENQKIYTAADIHQYLSGKMDPSQMHAIEKAALDDPLLAEAIEGYNGLPGFSQPQGFDNVNQHLNELKDKINSGGPKTGTVKRISNVWRAAAAILLLLGGTIFAIYINNSLKTEPGSTVAKTEPAIPTHKQEPTKDTTTIISQPGLVTTEPAAVAVQKPKAPVVKNEVKNNTVTAATYDKLSGAHVYVPKGEIPVPIADDKFADQAMDNDIASISKKENQGFLAKKSVANKNQKTFFSGKVIDKNNNAIPFAKLTTSAGQISTTDKNGQFNLPITKGNTEKVTFKAFNYQPKIVDAAEGYLMITLDLKKIITDKGSNATPGQAMVLDHIGAEPAEGWPKYLSFIISKISYSEYDNGKPVVGETIVSFEIGPNLEPINFVFEKQIDTDVNDAIEEVITNGPEWKITEPGIIHPIIKLKLNF